MLYIFYFILLYYIILYYIILYYTTLDYIILYCICYFTVLRGTRGSFPFRPICCPCVEGITTEYHRPRAPTLPRSAIAKTVAPGAWWPAANGWWENSMENLQIYIICIYIIYIYYIILYMIYNILYYIKLYYFILYYIILYYFILYVYIYILLSSSLLLLLCALFIKHNMYIIHNIHIYLWWFPKKNKMLVPQNHWFQC